MPNTTKKNMPLYQPDKKIGSALFCLPLKTLPLWVKVYNTYASHNPTGNACMILNRTGILWRNSNGQT